MVNHTSVPFTTIPITWFAGCSAVLPLQKKLFINRPPHRGVILPAGPDVALWLPYCRAGDDIPRVCIDVTETSG